MTPVRNIPGPILAGFHDLFEAHYGDVETERDMPTVHPSWVGNSMLPHRCPRCREVPQALACPTERKKFTDDRPGRGNVWCPLCGARYWLGAGAPLRWALPAGACVAPSRVVEADGRERWQDAPVFGIVVGAPVDYGALAV